MGFARVQAFVVPAAFVALLAVLSGLGAVSGAEFGWLSFAAVLGFALSGWFAPGGWRRRAAEALLLPAACAAVLIDAPVMRLAIGPPLVFLGAWAAAEAWLRRSPERAALIAASLGAVGVALSGFALAGSTSLGAGAAVAGGLVVPWSAARLAGARAGIVAALIGASLPLHHWPGPVLVIVAVALPAAILLPYRQVTGLDGWMPAAGAAALIGLSLAPWGGLGLSAVFPSASWVGIAALVAAALVALRFPPAPAGASFLLAVLLLGPALPPTPEGGRTEVTFESPTARLARPGTGAPYQLQVALADGARVGQGATVAWLDTGEARHPLRAGENVVAWDRPAGDAPEFQHGPPEASVWRVAGRPGGEWRQAGRLVVEVPEDIRPVLRRNQGIRREARVVVLSAGPSQPTRPRDWPAETWLWAAAAVVAILQLLSGRWLNRAAGLPWTLILTGLVLTRAAVEPHRLLLERWSVDLALAAVLAAWLPAAVGWLRRRRRFTAAATLLVPLALATVHLTPPLWGDEPYHLALLESAVVDRDLDLGNQLDPEAHAAARPFLAAEHFFHSPILAALLLPGYLVAGRAGAVALVALAAAAVVAVTLGPAARRLGLGGRWVPGIAVLALLTLPLAPFATQIWAEVPGALALAVILALPMVGQTGRLAGMAAAVVATAVKTRLALVTFPVALAAWWRGDRRQRLQGLLAAAVGAIAALGAGWLLMGHPFGLYRRVHHLLPTDLRQAMVTLGGLLFDVAGGLAWSAPLWLLALAALPLLWRQGDVRVRAALLGGAATLAALLHSFEWYGGGSPPGRYLTPLLPVVLLALAALASRPAPRRRLLLVLAPAALLPWWALVTRPHFSVNPGDGRWWLTNALSRRFEADARALFPSFLVPTEAAILIPLVLVAVAAGLWWLAARPGRARVLVRVAPALWLVAATGLVAAVELRRDTVVEAEAAQVRRHRGAPVPPVGTPSRSRTPNGWRLADGHGLTFPLRVRAGDRVRIEGWTAGSGSATALEVSWERGASALLPITPGFREGGLLGPPAPADGRQRLQLRLVAPARGETLVVDRVVVE